jgi:hypothetical protein
MNTHCVSFLVADNLKGSPGGRVIENDPGKSLEVLASLTSLVTGWERLWSSTRKAPNGALRQMACAFHVSNASPAVLFTKSLFIFMLLQSVISRVLYSSTERLT